MDAEIRKKLGSPMKSHSEDNVRSIMGELVRRNAEATVDMLMTEEFLTFLLDEGEKQFKTLDERKAFVLGGATAIGFYGKEIKRGMKT